MIHREYLQTGESLSGYIVQVSEAEAHRADRMQQLYAIELQLQLCPARDTTRRAELLLQIQVLLQQQENA